MQQFLYTYACIYVCTYLLLFALPLLRHKASSVVKNYYLPRDISSIRNMQQGKIVVSSFPAPIFCPVHSQFREYTVVAHTANLHNCVGVCWATSDEDY